MSIVAAALVLFFVWMLVRLLDKKRPTAEESELAKQWDREYPGWRERARKRLKERGTKGAKNGVGF